MRPLYLAWIIVSSLVVLTSGKRIGGLGSIRKVTRPPPWKERRVESSQDRDNEWYRFEAALKAQKAQMRRDLTAEPDHHGCTGLCYYNKLLGIQVPDQFPAVSNTSVIHSRRQSRERQGNHRPCVGLCHHYRKMGQDEAFNQILLHETSTTKKPTSVLLKNSKVAKNDGEPCVGLCYHHRKNGIPYP